MRQARRLTLLGILTIAALAFLVGSAAAASPAQWTVTAVSSPTNLTPGDLSGDQSYQVTLTNTGGTPSDGSPVTITDELPQGVSLASSGAVGEDELAASHNASPSADFSCVLRSCVYSGTVVPDDSLSLTFPIDVSSSAPSPTTNIVRVSGGDAPDASVSTPTVISQTPAEFGISPGGAAAALSTTQAGAHPDLTNSIAFNTVNASGALAGDPKDVAYDLPPGFAGDLIDTPSCSAALFALEECPIGTQIGVTAVYLRNGSRPQVELAPVYNLAPSPGEVAKIGFPISQQFFLQGGVTLRPGDDGLRTTFQNVNESFAEIVGVSLTIWGVPADPIHDPLRWAADFTHVGGGVFGATSDAGRVPFLTNPTSCLAEPLHSSFQVDSWQQPAASVEETMPLGPLVGCDRLTIDPSIEAQSTSSSAESPTGLNVHMKIPQTYDNPDGLATSHLRDARVTLPEGMSLNPSAGAGLGDCTLAQFEYEELHFESEPDRGCPADSKIGSVRVRSPSLLEEAAGSLFVARPFENKFNSLLALYLVARIPDRGVVVAAAGKVTPDPLTGQLTTTFDENPQLPFSDFTLAFRQGQTSPLITPPVCGPFTAAADLTPWSVPSQEHLISAEFGITSGVHGGPCPSGGVPPFAPLLHAGSYSNQGGSYSPFYLRLSREDGEQEITHFSIKLPPGVIGKLAGVTSCSDAAIVQARAREHEQGGAEEEAAPSCPANSEVGHTEVEAGVGAVLASAPGHVYLAGPYHGSQLSLVSITAAKVGPFDLGTVVVRFGLKINPETAAVSVDGVGSDPIPHIIDGIPVHLRNIRTYVDRPKFVLNPTNCEPTSTASTVLGSGKDFVSEADDQPITVTSPFQVANCAALGFKPKLALSLKGGTRRGATPAFKAVLTARPGDANIGAAQVTLPHSEFLEQGHIGTVCTRVQFKEGTVPGEKCPKASVYGRARAITPILDEALEGPVYLRSSSHPLPDLVAALHNRQVDIALAGRIDSVKNGRIRNTFEAVPDAPVSKFTLEMRGGKKGLLVNSTNLCKTKNHAISEFTGQNGKIYDTNPVLKAKCGGKGKKAHKHRSAH